MLMKSFKRLITVVILASALLTVQMMQLRAQTAREDAQAVITNQLESFLSGDFEKAYSHASDNIKRMFPSVDRFMQMVQGGYLPVLRPGNYAFGTAKKMNGERIRQDVLIRAPDGSDWTATYFMQLIEGGVWKVDGVQLRKGAAGMT